MAAIGMPNAASQQTARTNGRNSTSSVSYAGERATLAQSSAAFGSGGWNSNIWSRTPMTGISSTMVESTHPKVATTVNGDTVTGSRSLLPSSEAEGWAGQPLPWNFSPTSSSHASSVNAGASTPPGNSAVVNAITRSEALSYLAAAQPSGSNMPNSNRVSNWSHYHKSSDSPSSITAFDNGVGRNSQHTAALNGITNGSTAHNGLSAQEPQVNPFDHSNTLPFREGPRSSDQASYFPPSSSMNLASMTPSSSHFGAGTPRHSISTGHGRASLAEDELAAALSKIDVKVAGALAEHRQQALPPRPSFQQRASYDAVLSRANYTIEPEETRTQYATYSRTISSPSVNLPSLIRRQERGHPSLEHQRSSIPGYYSSVDGQLQDSMSQGMYSPRYRYSGSERSPEEQAELLAQGLRATLQQQQEQAYPSVAMSQLPGGIHLPPGYRYATFQPPQPSTIHPIQLPLYSMGPFSPVSPSMVHRPSTSDQDSNQVTRSPVLQEFRANNKGNKRYELKDIYGHIVEFCGDQHGSRFIQLKLETANSDEKERVFQEIRPNAVQLMMDLFGNYVIQKLFEHGNQAQKRLLAQQMQGNICSLSVQTYGCRTVQKALEHVLVEQQATMVKELEDSVMKCVTNQNGNHVIQKAIERVPNQHIRFIIDEFRGQIPRYATHTYGCRVIQRMLEHCPLADRLSILAEIHACTPSLISDQYGNYVIQHIIEFGEEVDKNKIISIVLGQAVHFSKHKFASNVVEKSITFGTMEQRLAITRILSAVNEKGEGPLLGLMRDQYGNYVIQKSLSVLEGEDYKMLVSRIMPLMPLLKKCSYGKQIAGIEGHLHKYGHQTSSSPSSPVDTNKSLGLDVENNANSLTYTRDNSPVYDLSPVTADRSSIPSANTSVLEECPPIDMTKEDGGAILKPAAVI
ncbi:pumilio domain-containing protein [Nannizzia gypsea CBS 118893]|uniref:Pumilio homology domain family member 3 n=1 Tax=Arthroderma gypseum (strain ATCC MYA-4604 / CBS 118893) TaxID=535722 RepID=E5QYT8_ARTGP|nr:pumilio domain-containing protein [Nannizzia gypsea CBS 118893]EFQ97276.1 pumilio domain-containing protein [Nannizzia gypsea CBS 118893]